MSRTPQPAPEPRAAAIAGRTVLGAALAVASWLLVKAGVYVGHTVTWECYGGECSTNDWRSLLPVAGVLCNVALAVAMTMWLRVLGFGLAAAVGPLAAVSGWRAAVADGLVRASDVATEATVFAAAGASAGLVAILGLLSDLRVTGYGARFFGARRVPAALTDFRLAEGDLDGVSGRVAAETGVGTATMTFSSGGRRHASRVKVRREWLDEPVFAVFRETREGHAQLVRAWSRPSRADAAAEAAERAASPAGSLATELERLAALHADGHLTAEEFGAAKRRLLDT